MSSLSVKPGRGSHGTNTEKTVSSHHFVKEGQEPALAILEAYSLEAVEPLLEWAPLVIVAEAAIDEVVRWGIKIDVVVAKEEKARQLFDQLSDQGPIKFLVCAE